MSRWTPIETYWSQALVRANMDARDANERAADITGDDVLTALLREGSLEHATLVQHLSTLLVANGETPPTHGTASGFLRRWWLDVVGHLKSDEDEFLLEQVLRFEARAKRVLDNAVLRCSSAQLRPLLHQHGTRLERLNAALETRRCKLRASA